MVGDSVRVNMILSTSTPIVVAGAGGFIGGHLVKHLRNEGFWDITAIDIKPVKDWHQVTGTVWNYGGRDLRKPLQHELIPRGSFIFNLAADMGGMGFIENNKSACMLSSLINTHLLQAAIKHGAVGYLFSSSACVYNASKQTDPNVTALREEDAYPADAEDGYGWEKLLGERMCRHFMEDHGLPVFVPRFHNVYGPHGTWKGGREKAPAAICRKIIEARDTGSMEIDIWGDGSQTRSFMYIDDCIDGMERIIRGDAHVPVNLGSSELVSINKLVTIVEDIAGVSVRRTYDKTAPQGVRGRNSDNTLIKNLLRWEPSIPLREGMEKTFKWIEKEMAGE